MKINKTHKIKLKIFAVDSVASKPNGNESSLKTKQTYFIFSLGNLTNETVIAQVGCAGKTIVEFTTSSPTGLIKTNIINPSTG
jgi:hypothetical protein